MTEQEEIDALLGSVHGLLDGQVDSYIEQPSEQTYKSVLDYTGELRHFCKEMEMKIDDIEDMFR